MFRPLWLVDDDGLIVGEEAQGGKLCQVVGGGLPEQTEKGLISVAPARRTSYQFPVPPRSVVLVLSALVAIAAHHVAAQSAADRGPAILDRAIAAAPNLRCQFGTSRTFEISGCDLQQPRASLWSQSVTLNIRRCPGAEAEIFKITICDLSRHRTCNVAVPA